MKRPDLISEDEHKRNSRFFCARKGSFGGIEKNKMIFVDKIRAFVDEHLTNSQVVPTFVRSIRRNRKKQTT